MPKHANLTRLGKDQRGAALVEFSLLAPLLISLACGLAEFGQALRQYTVMQKGARDAAHYLARAPSNPCPAPDAAWTANVTAAKALAINGSVGGTTPRFKGWTQAATITVPAPQCLPNPRLNGADLPRITVTIAAPYADIGMLRSFSLTPITITVSSQELKVS
ncbi:TadE/TadG family type IV pilus assembly protein [Phenylobacterium sp.]|jgi:Flp pilus assembly protein TadG|uniref:TadE/TadG family type IV pilus assembly protein n=1 Tax=Phenylobacterium sp. TaxID=1871053 RepID=UPI0037846281